MNKKDVIAIFLILLVLGFFLFILIHTFTKHPDTSTDSVTVGTSSDFAAPQRWDDMLIAGTILDWLEYDMKDERGTYRESVNCEQRENGAAVCDYRLSSNNTGMAVIWSNYVFWQRTGDIVALERMKADLAVYANRDVVENIQTDNLSCYYLLPIILDENPTISGADRLNAMFTCFETEYENTIGDSIVAPPLALLLEETGYKVNLIMGMENSSHEQANTFPFRRQFESRAIVPNRNWIDLATEHIVRYQLDPREHWLDLARAYYIGALDIYLSEPEPDNNLTCPLLLASQEMCFADGEIGVAACNLAYHLGNKVIFQDNDGFTSIENLAKCAFALPTIRAHFAEQMKTYYYSQANANANAQFTEPWLLNTYQGQTKKVIDNALFAGMILFNNASYKNE